MISKLISSIPSNWYIFVFMVYSIYVALRVGSFRNRVENEIYDWEEESNELSTNPEKTNKIFNHYKSLNRNYTVFVTVVSIFPLLGMFGTVIALLSIDMSNVDALNSAKTSFFDALTSTVWGLIFAIVFKFVNACAFSDVEDLIQRLLTLKKKLIKYGIDESIKNKSGWRV